MAITSTKARAAATLVLLLCALLAGQGAQAMTISITYGTTGEHLQNPFIGNVVWASSKGEHEQPFSLVYADVTWAALEPEKGVYDFEAFEARNNLDYWREQDKHVILRFVMDKPGSDAHRDIPQWLYEATGKDGEAYSISYGRGYNPNYANEVLIEAHRELLLALGERYDDDPVIAFVQLGSLGHWGEWHVHSKLATLPDEATRDRYAAAYAEAFTQTKLMMRRPFTHAARYEMGLFNDASADVDATEEWLDWIADGGEYTQTGETDAIVPMPDAWRTSPIGGELSTEHSRKDLLGDQFDDTLALFTRSHASWIGPGSFADIEKDSRYQANLDTLMRTLGYRLWISRIDLVPRDETTLSLAITWQNSGIAPFYFGWTPCLRVAGASGGELVLPMPVALIDIQPDTPLTITMELDLSTLPQGERTLSAGIINPATGAAGVALAMGAPEQDGWYELVRLGD